MIPYTASFRGGFISDLNKGEFNEVPAPLGVEGMVRGTKFLAAAGGGGASLSSVNARKSSC